jgi:hypothetical protein
MKLFIQQLSCHLSYFFPRKPNTFLFSNNISLLSACNVTQQISHTHMKQQTKRFKPHFLWQQTSRQKTMKHARARTHTIYVRSKIVYVSRFHGSKYCLCTRFHVRFLCFWKWKKYVIPKRRNKSTLHCAQTQKVDQNFKPQQDGSIEMKSNLNVNGVRHSRDTNNVRQN